MAVSLAKHLCEGSRSIWPGGRDYSWPASLRVADREYRSVARVVCRFTQHVGTKPIGDTFAGFPRVPFAGFPRSGGPSALANHSARPVPTASGARPVPTASGARPFGDTLTGFPLDRLTQAEPSLRRCAGSHKCWHEADTPGVPSR